MYFCLPFDKKDVLKALDLRSQFSPIIPLREKIGNYDSLDRGIYIDGNFVPIEIEGADWVDKDDSLLKAQVAVQVMITFNGGVYRDTGFAPLTDVRVTSVEKNT